LARQQLQKAIDVIGAAEGIDPHVEEMKLLYQEMLPQIEQRYGRVMETEIAQLKALLGM